MRSTARSIVEDYKTQHRKFVEKEGVSSDIVKDYLRTFKKLKDRFPKAFDNEMLRIGVPVERRRDIDAYSTFKEVETIVDFIKGQVDLPVEDVRIVGDTTIHEDDVLKISKGTSPEVCMSIRKEGAQGKNISWCVALAGSSNMYYRYRLNSGEPTFYFVQNKTRKDKYFFFVVQITKDGEYIVTSSDNDGDLRMTWDEIIEIEPKLKKFKGLIKHNKITSDERVGGQFKNLTADGYTNLLYRHKKQYIEAFNKLDFNMFRVTPMDLIEYYINLGKFTLTSEQEGWLADNNKKLYDRYLKLLRRKIGDNAFLLDLWQMSSDNLREEDLEQYKGEHIQRIEKSSWQEDLTLHVDSMESLFDEADIRLDELSTLEYMTTNYYDHGYADESELDYMWNYIENEELLIKLLKRVGVKKRELDSLGDDHGLLRQILGRFSFGEKIMREYLEQYSAAEEAAVQKEAEEMLEKYRALPLEFDERTQTIDIEDVGDFVAAVIDIDNTVKNFDEAIIKLLENVDLSGSELYPHDYYNHVDFTNLVAAMENEITDALEDLEYSNDGLYFDKVNSELEKLGFKDERFENERVVILVDEKLPENIGDEITQEMLDDPTIGIRFINKETGKKEEGNVKLSSLPNYMHNYQLFESIKRIKRLMVS